MIRAMSVSCLPRIHICACAIKSKQTATSHLYTFIQSNLLSLCKLCIHFLITQYQSVSVTTTQMKWPVILLKLILLCPDTSIPNNQTWPVGLKSIQKNILYIIYIYTRLDIYTIILKTFWQSNTIRLYHTFSLVNSAEIGITNNCVMLHGQLIFYNIYFLFR